MAIFLDCHYLLTLFKYSKILFLFDKKNFFIIVLQYNENIHQGVSLINRSNSICILSSSLPFNER